MNDRVKQEHVRSQDGTPIGYTVGGAGPPLVLVHGTTGGHWSFDLLAPHLTERFTVCAVDRRGRGESGDAADYSMEREFEDLAAVVDSLDEPAALFGHSYGATAALGAALATVNLTKLVLYEPSPGLSVVPDEVVGRLEELVAEGNREQALVETFRLIGLSDEEIDHIRGAASWPERVAAVHTVPREIRAEAAFRADPERLRSVERPVLLLLGEESPDWARASTEELSAALPNAAISILPGQGHAATTTAPSLVADEITRFLAR
jgi:pimeloyl-ACP methyl ester carboxylesterase